MTRGWTIAIVCYPSLGGSGIVATELAAGLAQRGHRVHVIASTAPSRPLPPCTNLYFHEVDVPSYPLFTEAPYTLALASTIAKVASDHAVAMLHVHYAVPHAASAFLARNMLGARAPRLVTTLHGTDVTRVGSEPQYRDVTRFCVEASDAITVPSEFLRGQAYETLGIAQTRAIEVIPNFVDGDHFVPAERRDSHRFDALFADAQAGAPVLFHASNFRAIKRVSDLLEVLARVRAQRPARLVLVGDGDERNAAEQRAQQLGLSKSVCFLGRRPDFVEYLKHADAFLLTSETESFGLAALEALSCGVPVLGYHIGGVPALVTDDVGRLVEPLDVDALAAQVLALIADPARRRAMGTAARARALLHYQPAPAFDHYEQLYARVLAEQPGPGT